MKTANVIVNSIICILLFAGAQLYAQKESRWIGGTPGQEHNWGCPKNWSDQRLPDEFSDVFIGNVSTTTFANPVLGEGNFSINSLFIESGGALTIPAKSSLTVNTYATYVSDENLDIKGSMFILNEHLGPPAELSKTLANNHD